MASNFLSLNPAKTEFLLVGLPRPALAKIHNPTITIPSNTTIALQPVSFARNLGVIFDSNLSFSDHISSYISKSCFSHVRDLLRTYYVYSRIVVATLEHKTAVAPIHRFLGGGAEKIFRGAKFFMTYVETTFFCAVMPNAKCQHPLLKSIHVLKVLKLDIIMYILKIESIKKFVLFWKSWEGALAPSPSPPPPNWRHCKTA